MPAETAPVSKDLPLLVPQSAPYDRAWETGVMERVYVYLFVCVSNAQKEALFILFICEITQRMSGLWCVCVCVCVCVCAFPF
jgi:hypothetical protein